MDVFVNLMQCHVDEEAERHKREKDLARQGYPSHYTRMDKETAIESQKQKKADQIHAHNVNAVQEAKLKVAQQKKIDELAAMICKQCPNILHEVELLQKAGRTKELNACMSKVII